MASRISVEARTQQLGHALLEHAAAYRPGPAERVEDWLLTHAVSDARFRGRLLRYLDVLSALDHDASGREAKRLAHEYFGATFPGLPRPLRWLLRIARNDAVPAPLVGESARRSAELFARRFITPPAEDTLRATTASLAELGRVPSFDLLGEAVLSDAEADAYVGAYLALIAQLERDPAAGLRTAGDNAALQVSLKLSSLAAHFSPVDAEGSIARVRPGLQAIAEAAAHAGIGLTVDMEQYALRGLVWEAFRRTFARGERLGSWTDAGIVLQGYLRDSHEQAEAVLAFAESRGTPFQVRLVKGAYWDFETIVAKASRWEPPVFTEKAATDARFETLTERLVGVTGVRLAVASHNARAHAFAEAVAEARGLPPGTIEHQTLYRTAEGTSRALATLGWVARDYVPVGELLPGMAYLVRRVLENASQAGFLLRSRAGVPPEELLRPPPVDAPSTVEVAPEAGGFDRAPAARWHDPAFRDDFERALASTRGRWGERFALGAGDEALHPQRTVEVRSPSHPTDAPMGMVEFAGIEATARALEIVTEGAAGWAARPPADRASILRRAADLLHARQHEFAAWVVHEGGRDRADAFAEVEEATDYLRYYALEAERLFERFGAVIAPRGVVAVIPPWNFSLAIPCGMTAAALATGNAAVLKPAEQTPLIAHRLVDLLHEAGVPRDALICLPGEGELVGDALARDPRVAMVAFTGSRAVGEHLHEVVSSIEPAAGGLKGLVAEMGGKNPIVVFADADLDEAIEGILRSAFGHANQKCSAASRILVQEPIAERLRARLVEAAGSVRVGPADAPGTQVNPVIDGEALTRLHRMAARARIEGNVILDHFEVAGASALEVGPLIVEIPATAARTAATAREELFGPILTVTRFETEAEAYELANDTAYGLTAGVYSRSPRTIERACEAIEAGSIYVNRPITGARVGVEPFGGLKMSGTGPKAGSPDYLWAFVRRTDASRVESQGATIAASVDLASVEPAVAARWTAPIEARIAAIEEATVRLGESDTAAASELYAATQAARRELALPAPTLQVAGQRTELRHDLPRGHAVIDARGAHALWRIGATLLGGNACSVFAADEDVERAVGVLHQGGVPAEALRLVEGGLEAALALARQPDVAFLATGEARRFAVEAYRALGPTAPGQRSLKVLISPLDGPQPGEPGFLRRFTWPRVVAVRTLRHGADLAFES